MASIPNVDNLGNRLDISFEATSYHNGTNADKIETLIDGSLAAKTKYGVLVTTNTQSHFKFTVNSECRIWAYGTTYSDSGGRTPQKVKLYKDDVEIGEYQTKANEWYVLFEYLEAGNYQIKVLDKSNNYNQFTEWYVEELEDKIFAVKHEGKYYSLSKDNYDPQQKMFKESNIDELKADRNKLVSKEYLTRSLIIDGEEFKPLYKFNNPKLICLDNITVNVQGIKSNTELVLASNNFSTSIIDSIDFIDSVSTIDENSNIKMVVSNDYGQTWLTTNDNGFNWTELNVNSINKSYEELSSQELEAWNNFKNEVAAKGFNMKELSTINFNPIKKDVLRFAYVLNIQDKENICRVELLNIQFDTHGKIQKLKDSEVDITMDSFNAYIIPSRDIQLMKINMLG